MTWVGPSLQHIVHQPGAGPVKNHVRALEIDRRVHTKVLTDRVGRDDLVILDSTRLQDERGPYHQLIFTGRQGIFRLKWKQHYRVFGRKAYVLTFTAQESRFAAYLEQVDRVMQSFALRE
jgi:hypothetical protein